MTPFGARLRALRQERGITQRRLATELQVSTAYLSALEHGKRGAPSAGLVHQVNEFFGLIWDDADELRALARLSNPRVTVNTAGLSPEQTALANRLAQAIHRLSPETVAALHAMLDTTTAHPKPRLRRAARKGSAAAGRRPNLGRIEGLLADAEGRQQTGADPPADESCVSR
jgi:transcriptional regulator with XRE-family HTH domain